MPSIGMDFAPEVVRTARIVTGLAVYRGQARRRRTDLVVAVLAVTARIVVGSLADSPAAIAHTALPHIAAGSPVVFHIHYPCHADRHPGAFALGTHKTVSTDSRRTTGRTPGKSQ